jgi:site-specific DNA-methyltransferase (adenine-specific)/modification methylase
MKVNHIYNWDCTQIFKNEITKWSISLIFADPPYNLSWKDMKLVWNKTGWDWQKVNEKWDTMSEEDYFEFTNEWIKSSYLALKEWGSIYISSTYHNLWEVLMNLKTNWFKIQNIITWYKSNSMPNITKRSFTHACEYIVWATKWKWWTFNYEVSKEINPEKQKDWTEKQMRDMWILPLCQWQERIKAEDNKSLHPTQKPEELLKRIILIWSNEWDIVLDPFNWSGTTTYMAKLLNRQYIWIEKEEKYYKAILERMEKLNGGLF